jgi:hypothetical protein
MEEILELPTNNSNWDIDANIFFFLKEIKNSWNFECVSKEKSGQIYFVCNNYMYIKIAVKIATL